MLYNLLFAAKVFTPEFSAGLQLIRTNGGIVKHITVSQYRTP